MKVGPPTKKADAVSMAKSKQIKQETIKKSVRKSKYFFLLNACASDVASWSDGKVSDENINPAKKDLKTEDIHAQYAAKLKKLKGK